MELTFKNIFVNGDENKHRGFEAIVNGNEYLEVYAHPFWNCQVYCIANFVNVLRFPKLRQRWDILKELHKKVLKAQVLVDINTRYEKRLENTFKPEEIVFKQRYISTNNSPMTMYLLLTKDILKK